MRKLKNIRDFSRENYHLGFLTLNIILGVNVVLFAHGTVKADTINSAQQVLNQNAVSTRSLDLTQKTNSIMPLAVSPTSITHSGVSGTATWDIDSTGKLTVHAGQLAGGKGNWSPYASSITSVYVDEGVRTYNSPSSGNGVYNAVFSELPNVVTIDVSEAETLGGFFNKDPKLQQIIGLDKWSTSVCKNMSTLFSGDSALKSVDISNFDTSNVTSMNEMFKSCSSLVSLDVSNFNTAKVSNMAYMFMDVKAKINGLANLNLGSVETLSGTLYGVDFTINNPDDIKDWDVSNVTDMNSLFRECKFASLDLSKWNISKVTNMSSMFQSDSNINQVKNIADWDVSNVTNMSSMFLNVKDKDLSIVNDWDVSNVTSMGFMFNSCTNLESLDLSKWNTKSLTSTYYMFAADGLLNENNFKGYDTLNISKVTNMGFMFQGTGFTTLDLSKYNTSNVTNMNSLFASTSKLQKIIGNFNMDNVTDMGVMFSSSNVSDFSELNIADWNTSKVENMTSTFSGTKKLKDFSFLKNWNVSSVTNLQRTFYGASSAEEIPVEKWDVSKVKTFNNTFYGTSAVTNLPIENWDVSSGTDFSGTFWASGVKTVDLSKWNTSNGTTFYAMFNSMDNLETLDLSNLDMTNATDVQYMFGGDKNLWKITLGPKSVLTNLQGKENPVTARLLVPVAGTPIQDSNTTGSYKAISDKWQEVGSESGGTDHEPVGDLISADDIMDKFSTIDNPVTTYVWQQQPKVNLEMSVPDLDFGTTSNASGLVSRKTKDFAVTVDNQNYPEEAMDAKLSVSLTKPLTDSFDATKTLNDVLIFRNNQNSDTILSTTPTEVYNGQINFGTNQLSWDDKHGLLLNMNNDRYAQNGHYSGTLEWDLTNSI